MDRKQVLSKHEWWIDLLSFFSFVGACLFFVLIAKYFPSSNIMFMLLGGLFVSYIFLHKKIKNYIIDKLSD
jgi:hypothetical protein